LNLLRIVLKDQRNYPAIPRKPEARFVAGLV
jgi:hypothetical protein